MRFGIDRRNRVLPAESVLQIFPSCRDRKTMTSCRQRSERREGEMIDELLLVSRGDDVLGCAIASCCEVPAELPDPPGPPPDVELTEALLTG